MSCDSTVAVHITKKGISKIIGPLLVDKNILVRTCSASALRSIVDNGKMEAHAILLKDDIMTPLCSLLKQVSLMKCSFLHVLFILSFFPFYIMIEISNLYIIYSIIQIGNQKLIIMRKPK